MATSDSTSFLPDILDLCQEAAERAGVDFTSGQSLRSARMALDLMSLEWANEGLNLWLVDSQSIVLLPGTSTYILPGDTLDVLDPLLRTLDENSQTRDLPLVRADVMAYGGLPDKQRQGRPTQIYVNRQGTPQVTLYPVPDKIGYTLVLYRMRRIQDTGAASNTMDVPSRFIPALVAGLTYRFAMKSRDAFVLQKVPLLKQEYRETLDKARYEDRDKGSVFLTPFMGY